MVWADAVSWVKNPGDLGKNTYASVAIIGFAIEAMRLVVFDYNLITLTRLAGFNLNFACTALNGFMGGVLFSLLLSGQMCGTASTRNPAAETT